MKDLVIGTVIVLITIWGGAFALATLTGTYAGAAYLTTCIIGGFGIAIGLKGLK